MATPVLLDAHGHANLTNSGQVSLTDSEKSIPKDEEAQGTYVGTATATELSFGSDDETLRTKFYEPPDSYESKHRWDPKATWTEEEEKKLDRKLDWRIMFFACVCFFSLCLDRSNIGSALSDGFLADIGCTTADYNNGQTIFLVAFLLSELPSQLISKKIGSDRWIPIQMMVWSLVTLGNMGIKDRGSYFALRALLGIFEGGFIADTVLYLSYYYTTVQLTTRLGYFWISLTVASIAGSLLAAGILELRHHTHLAGWRWLFMIEGLLTFLIGVFAWFYLPPGPTQTAGGPFNVRGKGWFTEREEVIIVNRVLRDDPTKSDMHNRQGISLSQFKDSIIDYDLWPCYAIGIVFYLAQSTVGAYFTLTLKSLGYSTFHTNLLVIPSSIVMIINIFWLTALSKKLKERFLVSTIGAFWGIILFAVLVAIPSSTNKWGKWALLSLIVSTPYYHPITVSTVSGNSGSVRMRTVSLAVYNMMAQVGGIAAAHVYNPSDAPYYPKGNKVLLGVVILSLAVLLFSKAYYVLRNRYRAKIWDSWSPEEKHHYLQTTTDKGNKRLDFRFVH